MATRTEIKHEAQDMLLHFTEGAILAASEGHSQTEIPRDVLIAEIEIQINRIRRLFGYDPA